MIKFALIGTGRIGRMHAANIVDSEKSELVWVYDINQAASSEVADKTSSKNCESVATILEDTSIDAVLISSSTDTHADFIIQSARAGKDIFC